MDKSAQIGKITKGRVNVTRKPWRDLGTRFQPYFLNICKQPKQNVNWKIFVSPNIAKIHFDVKRPPLVPHLKYTPLSNFLDTYHYELKQMRWKAPITVLFPSEVDKFQITYKDKKIAEYFVPEDEYDLVKLVHFFDKLVLSNEPPDAKHLISSTLTATKMDFEIRKS